MESGSLYNAAWLEGDYQPHVFAYYFKQWNGFRMAFHQHNSTEIMYVISGDCRVDIEPEPERTESVTLKKGEFIVLDANVPHRLMVDEACRMLNVEFGFAPRHGSFPSVRELASADAALASLLAAPSPYMVLRDPDEVYYALKSLVLELGAVEKGAMVHLLFAQLLIRIARLRLELEKSGLPQAEYYVKRSLEHLHQNYDREIRIKDIAAAVNLHPGYLQRIFKTHTGRTITDYLTELRMEKAKMLLAQTNIPILDISEYIGIGSRQYFHMLFKKHTRRTPMEYRRSAVTQKRDYPPPGYDF